MAIIAVAPAIILAHAGWHVTAAIYSAAVLLYAIELRSRERF